MTAIVAYRSNDKVYMGGDSRASDGGYSILTIGGKKVFKKGNILFGIAGLVPPLQCIRDIYNPLAHDPEWSDDAYMTRLSFDIKTFLSEYSVVMLDDQYSTALLLGYNGNIYYMTPDNSMNQLKADGFFLGSGGESSYSAALAYMKNGYGVAESLLEGLAICGNINMSVGEPYYVLEL